MGVTTVEYKVTDPANNMTACTFTVTVQDKEAPKVTCPTNVLVGMDNEVCYATRTNAQLRPTATDNCSTDALMIPANTTHSISGALIKATTTGLVPSNTQFPAGISYITYTVHDGAAPTTNSATCQFVIEVYDNQAPTLPNCPNGQTITVNTDGTMSPSNPIVAAGLNYPAFNITPTTSPSNGCGIQISYPTPTALDNCAASSMTNTGGMGSGLHYYGVGTHTETWKATDANGNTVACSFTILVKDNEYH
ncbi:MAG: HYR domain-containing protein [Saprospiraceae bacterium]|nr:HYR domain-containing protein [Saprospiraceae bacterium]